MDKYLRKRLKHIVQIKPCITRDSYGDKVFGEPVTHRCYRYGKVTPIVDLEGEQTVSTLQLIVDGVLPLGKDDEIIFQGEEHRLKGYSHFDGLKPETGTTVVYI